jgi:hypothetical protein
MNKLERTNTYNNGIDQVCRYMDLNKFIDFVINRRIYLSRMDGFEDPYEAISKEQLERLFAESEDMENEEEDEVQDISTKSLPSNKETSELSILERQKGYFVSCWFSENSESLAMWKLYAGNEGALVKVKLKELVKLFGGAKIKLGSDFISESKIRRFYHGNVDYLKFADPVGRSEMKTNTRVMGFHKDKAYEHEKEFRFLLKLKSKYRIDYQDMNEPMFFDLPYASDELFSIVLNPMMPVWQRQNIKSVVSQFKRRFNICESTLRVKTKAYLNAEQFYI